MNDDNGQDRRTEYLRSRTGDLTSYFAMIGDTFRARVDMLGQLIRGRHDQSLGRYKERLLANTISQFLPQRYRVGSGFVLFPTERVVAATAPDLPTSIDLQNLTDHEVSRQLDLIVYDAWEHPVLFHDGDVVVLRPESVRAVVEVTGMLRRDKVDKTVDAFVDYGEKWARCGRYYRTRMGPHAPKLPHPALFLMAFGVYVSPEGTPDLDGPELRRRIVAAYRSAQSREDLASLPILRQASVYATHHVRLVGRVESDVYERGYAVRPYQFTRYDENGQARREPGDATISQLLADIQVALETPFNQFFAYPDQSNKAADLEFETLFRGDIVLATTGSENG